MTRRLIVALLALVALWLPVCADAAISRVGSCSANTGTPVTCTFSSAPAAGDAIVVFAYRAGSNTQPTIPSTYGLIENVAGASTNSAVLAMRISDGTETTVTSTQFTNATGLAAVIYRGGLPGPVGIFASGSGASTSIAYPGLTLTASSAWVVGFAGHRTATNVNQAPSGMTLVSGTSSGTSNVAVSDTNAAVASWAGGSVTVGTSSGWYAYAVEILPLPTGESTSKINVDNYLHMVGTTVTQQLNPATNLATGNDGLEDMANCYVLNSVTNPAPNYTVTAHFQSALATIHLRSPSTDYATSTSTNSISIAQANTECRWEGLWSTRKRGSITVAGWVAFPPDVAGSGQIFDLWRQTTVDGNYCVMQLNNGNYNGNATGYGITAEVDADNNGTPEKIGLLTLSASTTYWVALYCNWQSGVVKVAAYNTSGVQVGSTLSGAIFNQNANGPYIDDLRIGNAEIGSSPHPTVKFEDIVVDYTGAFPLGPTAGATSGPPSLMLMGLGTQ